MGNVNIVASRVYNFRARIGSDSRVMPPKDIQRTFSTHYVKTRVDLRTFRDEPSKQAKALPGPSSPHGASTRFPSEGAMSHLGRAEHPADQNIQLTLTKPPLTPT
jgi:hypothetical protein